MYFLSSYVCVRAYVCVCAGEFDMSSSVNFIYVHFLFKFLLFCSFVSFCALCSVTNVGLFVVVCESLCMSSVLSICISIGLPRHESSLVGSATPTSPIPTHAGQDKRSEPEQRGGCLLHPDWWPGPGHAGGTGGVLLQVQDRVAPNEGVHRTSRCCLSCSGLSLLSLRQWC